MKWELIPTQQIVKAFPKAGVVVVALERPLRLGDRVCLQRSVSTADTSIVANVSGSRWQGPQVCGVDQSHLRDFMATSTDYGCEHQDGRPQAVGRGRARGQQRPTAH